MKERLELAKSKLEKLLTTQGLLEFSVKFHNKYEAKHGTALDYCFRNMTQQNALDQYVARETATKTRYLEMVHYQYDKQMKLF